MRAVGNTVVPKEVTLSSVAAGDPALLAALKKASLSEDDPLLIFDWNPDGVAKFLAAAATYVGPPPPFPLPNPCTASDFQRGLLEYVRSLGPPGAPIPIGRVGLPGTMESYSMALCNLTRFSDLGWAPGVLANTNPPATPIATLYTRQAGWRTDQLIKVAPAGGIWG
eukprot:comp24120_c8_seq2/m.43708 comp24120_c8_seq2/g.43708  ORF comp24120_c8_seq2/g.43708 comp24120_c8_seq2/m.43708 type:complete len:167 (-) comp24120_c8_seq2:600-1100(-)